ncbi:hypothetical protein Ancab_038711 [Ancistrocladus abbreviatus]
MVKMIGSWEEETFKSPGANKGLKENMKKSYSKVDEEVFTIKVKEEPVGDICFLNGNFSQKQSSVNSKAIEESEREVDSPVFELAPKMDSPTTWKSPSVNKDTGNFEIPSLSQCFAQDRMLVANSQKSKDTRVFFIEKESAARDMSYKFQYLINNEAFISNVAFNAVCKGGDIKEVDNMVRVTPTYEKGLPLANYGTIITYENQRATYGVGSFGLLVLKGQSVRGGVQWHAVERPGMQLPTVVFGKIGIGEFLMSIRLSVKGLASRIVGLCI